MAPSSGSTFEPADRTAPQIRRGRPVLGQTIVHGEVHARRPGRRRRHSLRRAHASGSRRPDRWRRAAPCRRRRPRSTEAEQIELAVLVAAGQGSIERRAGAGGVRRYSRAEWVPPPTPGLAHPPPAQRRRHPRHLRRGRARTRSATDHRYDGLEPVRDRAPTTRVPGPRRRPHRSLRLPRQRRAPAASTVGSR